MANENRRGSPVRGSYSPHDGSYGGTQVKEEFDDGSRFVAYRRREDFTAAQEAWARAALRSRDLAQKSPAPVQLAYLVFSDHCTHRWLGDGGGPTLEMIMVAESVVGRPLDEFVVWAAGEEYP